jgi:hypothetical protein
MKTLRFVSAISRRPRAAYDWDIDKDVLWIEDLGGAKSVTNDMGNILQDLIRAGVNLPKYRIMYKDSDGTWDGVRIQVANPVFFVFFMLNEKNYELAKSKLLNINFTENVR